jgi:hypothetical protein
MMQSGVLVYVKLNAFRVRLLYFLILLQLDNWRLIPLVKGTYWQVKSCKIIQRFLENSVEDPHLLVISVATHNERKLIS